MYVFLYFFIFYFTTHIYIIYVSVSLLKVSCLTATVRWCFLLSDNICIYKMEKNLFIILSYFHTNTILFYLFLCFFFLPFLAWMFLSYIILHQIICNALHNFPYKFRWSYGGNKIIIIPLSFTYVHAYTTWTHRQPKKYLAVKVKRKSNKIHFWSLFCVSHLQTTIFYYPCLYVSGVCR